MGLGNASVGEVFAMEAEEDFESRIHIKVIHMAQRSVISAVETRVSLEACRSTVDNPADQQEKQTLSQARRKARTCPLTTRTLWLPGGGDARL